jgi:riboflavin kinase/FMN adenylyltransferase
MDTKKMENSGYVATIGMFDGVHRGHQFVLRQVIETAHERGLKSMAITFDHTLRREQLLTTLDEKLSLISKTGIQRTEVLQFSDSLKQMTAYEFMKHVLCEQLGVKVLLTGYDNRFGHNREEGFDDYVRYGQQLDIEVLQLPAEGDVSSSLVRNLLNEGRVDEATQALGHPYQLTGHVEHGEHIGTQLGFPTANLVPYESLQLVPATGAYAVQVMLDNDTQLYTGMMNIGKRPTFEGHRTTLEVHVLRLDKDLYGQRLTVHFIQRLRDEQRFDNVEALKQQLQRDAQQVEDLFNKQDK